jgi:hypothetical protein
MPDGWFVIGAGNRQEDRAVANRMSTALANRLVHLNMDVDVDLWLDWFWQNPLSEIQQAETVGFFIGFRRELLHSFDPTSRDLAYPTPRSWEMVAKLQATGLSPELESPLISGAVGTGASAEYLAFCRIYRSLPSLDSILLDPQQAKIPEEPSAKAAVVAGLAKKASPSNIGAILTYCARISREFEFMAVHLSRRFCPDVDHTRDMTKWQAANSKFLMAS